MTLQADIGLIGLAVMGQNLVLNMDDHDFTVAVFNRTASVVDSFMANEALGTKVIGTHSLQELVSVLKRPRRVMIMVKAGWPVDATIELLVPFLEAGDIIIDGGNSHFPDSTRRCKELAEKGILFIGAGVSGGEEGARTGPSIILGSSISQFAGDKNVFVNDLHDALYASKIVSYTQGYMLMRAASEQFGWSLAYGNIALMWRGGCIIRAAFLDDIKAAFEKNPKLNNLLFAPFFKEQVQLAEGAWRRVVGTAVALGIPVPAMSSALAFYDGYRSERLPANLIQAQRDYFGAHTYERVDRPRGEFFHTNWTGTGGDVTSSTYNA